jgi:predicted DNA-binding protein
MSLGRPPIKDRVSTGYSIRFPNAEFIPKLDEIARSQSTSRRKYIISVLEKAIDDYEKEGQTELVDFSEGAEATDNLVFMRVTQELKQKHPEELPKKLVYQKFRDEGFIHPKLLTFTKKAVEYLEKQGVKVWR